MSVLKRKNALKNYVAYYNTIAKNCGNIQQWKNSTEDKNVVEG